MRIVMTTPCGPGSVMLAHTAKYEIIVIITQRWNIYIIHIVNNLGGKKKILQNTRSENVCSAVKAIVRGKFIAFILSLKNNNRWNESNEMSNLRL